MPQTTTYVMPSLIGGITEQSPQSSTPSAAKELLNCLNYVKSGVDARGGSKTLKCHSVSLTDPFEHEIRRSATEHYKVFIENGNIEVFNLIDGTLCAKANLSQISPYLQHTGPARSAFDAVTVEDTTFIINKQKTVRMLANKSPRRPNQAIFYFKAGGYSMTYRATVNYNGQAYTVSYTTPDNSASANGQYIATNSLAQSLRDAIQASIIPHLPGGSYIHLTGSMLVLGCPDGVSFTVDSEDGAGDTHLISFKEWAKKFSDLPVRCTDGYVVGIRGSAETDKDDYWMKYIGSGGTGVWEEVVKPDTLIALDPSTMPHLVINDAVNSFQCKQAIWGNRLSGDGDKTSKAPNFVDSKIVSAQFISGRLGLFTGSSYMLSRSRNAYVFFPDTATTRLDTDPVGYDVATGTVTNVVDSLAISDKLFLWGDCSQIKIDSGEDPIREDTVDTKSSSNYEYDGRVSPQTMGLSSAVFGTELGDSNRLMEVIYQRGSPAGQIPLTDHCPDLLDGDLLGIYTGGTASTLVVRTSTSGSLIYVYQWANEGDQRVVSSWSRWTFPAATRVISAAMRGSDLYLILEIGGKVSIERLRMRQSFKEGIPLRLDHMVTEEAPKVFNAGEGHLTVTLPYSVPVDRRHLFTCLETEESLEETYRGRQIPHEWIDGSTVRLATSDPDLRFAIGAKIESRRRFQQLYIQTKDGPILPSRLLVGSITVSHTSTAEYRIEVRDRDESLLKTFEFSARRVSRKDVINNKVPVSTGEFDANIGRVSQEVWVDLVNDTPFPSTWAAASIDYSTGR